MKMASKITEDHKICSHGYHVYIAANNHMVTIHHSVKLHDASQHNNVAITHVTDNSMHA